MPRLTRTQKFADLRESLANDKETSLQTKDLSGYESRLNNITGEEPRRPELPQEDPKYVWKPFEDIHNEVEQTEEVVSTTISDLWNSVEPIERPAEETKEEDVPETKPESETVSIEAPVEETVPEKNETESVEEVPQNPYLGLYQRSPEVEAAYEEAERLAAEKAAKEAAEALAEQTRETEQVVEETVNEEPVKEEDPKTSPITDYILENPFAEFDDILSEKYAKENTQPELTAEFSAIEDQPVETETPAEEPVEPETPAQETVEVEVPAQESVEPIFEEEPVLFEDKTEETPVYEEIPVEEPVVEEPVQEEIFTEPVTEETQETIETEEVLPETPEYTEEPVYEEVSVEEEEELDADAIEPQPLREENPYMGFYHAPEAEATYEETEKQAAEEETTAESTDTVAETVAEVSGPEVPELPTDNHVPEHTDDTASALIHQTISEVDRYNEENGDLTIHTLTSNIVNEIRHGDSPAVKKEPETEKFEEIPVTIVDESEDFSNTVSMEITKIMNEVAENEDTHEIPVEEIVSAPVVEEHPVLTKALEEEPEEEVVEIRNLNELDAAPMQNTLSNTIPFVVAASEDEEIIDDDAQEDSNTILNIILIILIVILVAVLGLIIFYILKTKGII